MNLKAPPLYLLSFLLLVFLVQQLHDWGHVMAVRATCHCWPLRLFDSWELCGTPSYGQHALISIAGPLINVILLVTGYNLLHEDNPVEDHSLGVALVFAALPLGILIDAFKGAGDITNCIQWLQRHGPNSNRRFANGLGLIIQLILVVPALVRAFFRLPGYKGRLIAFPLLFLLPGWLERLWSRELNHWFIKPDTSFWQAYAEVGGWFLLLAVGVFLLRHRLTGLIRELSL